MNKYLILTLLLTTFGCASSYKIDKLRNSDVITLKYRIKYPSYKDMTKNKAKASRKEYLENAMQNIYASVFRLAYSGRSDFDLNNFDKLGLPKLTQYNDIPFLYKKNNTFEYKSDRKDGYSGYGFLMNARNQFPSGEAEHDSFRTLSWTAPIAKKSDGSYISSPIKLQLEVNENILIISKDQFNTSIKRFYENFGIVDAKNTFNKFLENNVQKFVSYHAPLGTLRRNMFSKSKHLQSGAGISDDVIPLKNTLNFSLKGENHRQTVWGLMFLLNSTVDAKRLSKGALEVTINVPVNKVMNKYSTSPLSKYIE